MLDKHYRNVKIISYVADIFHKLRGFRGVHACCRFIEQDDAGMRCKRTRYFKAALLTFAERWRLLHEAEDFDQSDLDNIFHRGAPPQQFSKGIDADTLEIILASVNAASAPVSTQEVADDVGLSRISVRKYLSYLEENNRIQGDLSYGGKGRPVKLYRAL